MVLAVLCLVLFGVFQVSQVIATKETLHYAAGRGLRAKTVGFNEFMVYKTVRVGAIPAAGLMTTPVRTGGPAAQYAMERARIPLYLGGDDYSYLPAILGYDRWDALQFPRQPGIDFDGSLHLRITDDFPLAFPMHRTFYAADTVRLFGESYLDSHYTLYMNDLGL